MHKIIKFVDKNQQLWQKQKKLKRAKENFKMH